MQAYSSVDRQLNGGLPDLEIWQEDAIECRECGVTMPRPDSHGCPLCGSPEHRNNTDEAWFETIARNAYWWQSCFPGCLPDGEPNGPFDSEEEALEDARKGMGD